MAGDSEIVFFIVGFSRDVRETILGENGIIKGAKKGSVVVDMTTSSSGLAAQIHATLKAGGLIPLMLKTGLNENLHKKEPRQKNGYDT